jgi:hypothetical protein
VPYSSSRKSRSLGFQHLGFLMFWDCDLGSFTLYGFWSFMISIFGFMAFRIASGI